MALKDMKSDLSKFRMPKKDPLESKRRDDVVKNQNQTPLSSMIESAPKIPRFQTTQNKEGVTPQHVTQGDKYKGQTTPTPVDNSERYKGQTTTIPMDNSEKYKGGTTPTPMDNSEKYKGQTTPTPLDNSEKYKGSTTPTPMNLEERFLGETTPNRVDTNSKFLGETTPKKRDTNSQFLGETTPTKFDNGSQFLGETTPKKSDGESNVLISRNEVISSPYAADATPMNLKAKFLGETEVKRVNQGDKYKGETNPTEMDNSSNFLGEADPGKMDNSPNFLGETTPNTFDNSSNFLGETNPSQMDNSSKFLGETNQSPMDNGSKFLGETTPNTFDNSSKFLGEADPGKMDNSSKFLGETDPNGFDNSSKFLGETNQSPMDNSSNFLGETNQSPMDNSSKFLGETDPSKMDNASRFLGETTQTPSNTQSQFLGETTPSKFDFNPNHQLNGKDPKFVNFITDDNAKGFLSYRKFKDRSAFVGIDPSQTVFNGATSITGQFTQKNYGVTIVNDGGLGKSYDSDTLNTAYNKFNLREDSYNSSIFKQPFNLSGIQKKDGEPTTLGVGSFSFIRGGAVTSTERALIDVARITKFLLTPRGVTWSLKQVALQNTNSNVETMSGKRLTKVWTPSNLIASIGGNHIGLHATRHNLLPFSTVETYGEVQKAKKMTHTGDATLRAPETGNRLVQLWGESFSIMGDSIGNGIIGKGRPFVTLQAPGGSNTMYGLVPSGRVPSRNEDTRPERFVGNTIYNQYATFIYTDAPNSTKQLDIEGKQTVLGPKPTQEENFREQTELGKLVKPYTEFKPNRNPTSDPNDLTNREVGTLFNDEATYTSDRTGVDLSNIYSNFEENGWDSSEYETPFKKVKVSEGTPHNVEKFDGAEIIKNYQTIAYGKIPKRIAGDTQINDFRNLLEDGPNKEIAKSDDYVQYNLDKRVNFNNPGKVGPSENRFEWWNTDKNSPGNTDRYDKIQASEIGDGNYNDLVHFWIQPHNNSGGRLQFRGAVNGITETFSPSWDSTKYNGRADSAYRYSTFERSITFNLQVYATSRVEVKPIWSKLQRLSTMTMPQYGDEGYQGVLVDFRLGNLWNNRLAFIDSLSYTMSDETPWEISMLGSKSPIGEVPIGIDVSIGLKILGNELPQYAAKTYDLNGI